MFNSEEIVVANTTFVAHAIGFPWNNVIIMLTTDRFLQVYFNERYDTIFTKKRTNIIISMCYLIGVAFVIVFLALGIDVDQKLRIFRVYLYPVYTGLVIISFVVTYSYYYAKYRKRKYEEETETENSPTQERKGRKGGLMISILIVVVHVIFIFIPKVLQLIIKHVLEMDHIEGFIYEGTVFCWTIGMTCHALIYIMLNKALKVQFIQWFVEKSTEEIKQVGGRKSKPNITDIMTLATNRHADDIGDIG